MIERYLSELSRELGAVGIRGRLRARILAEAEDHLRSDPEAPGRFGAAGELARRFADELGAEEARRAARGSFAALAVVGAGYAVAFVALNSQPPSDILGGSTPPVGFLAALGLILLPQVSFVAGVLAPLSRSPRIAVRRAGVGLAAGGASLGCAALMAQQFGAYSAWLWAMAPGAVAALAPAGMTIRAARIRPAAVAAGDVFDDLGPLVPSQLRGHPWRFAVAVAAVAAVAVGIAGASGGDPFEGIRNAILETVACLSGYALLGKYLGLRR